MPARITFEQQSGVVCVTLRNPKRFNAMSRAMWRQLQSVFEQIQASTDIRCVLVVGQGAHFCAGGDISEYASFRLHEASLRAFHEVEVWGALRAMLACDVPIVAQLAGNCMGAGVEIACCCDIRMAGMSAKFGAPIARLGFPMAPREAALVTRELGAMTARQFLLEAAVLGAPEMAQRGFISHLVADDALAQVTQATLQRMVVLAPQAARLNKQTLRTFNQSLALVKNAPTDACPVASDDSVAALMARAYAYADSAEQREGISAFLEKRSPDF